MRRTMESIAAERLNKIGKNPSLVSQREDLQTDLKAVNELITMSTMSAQSLSEDSDSEKNMLTIKKALPRPKSETCFKLGPIYNANNSDNATTKPSTNDNTSSSNNSNTTYNQSNTYNINDNTDSGNQRSIPQDRPRTHSTVNLKS